MRNWAALRAELEALGKKGEDCSIFSVRTDRLEGDESDARDHPKTRDLFVRPGPPRLIAERTPTPSRRQRPQAAYAKSKEREGEEREERERRAREEREREKKEELERRERAERERRKKEELARREREERERKEREELERRERAERERKKKEELERRERAERERRKKEELARRKRAERERKEKEELARREREERERKKTAAAASVRGRFEAVLRNGARSRARKDRRDRWFRQWPIAAGVGGLVLVALVLLTRGLSNEGSTDSDVTSEEDASEIVEGTPEGSASASLESNEGVSGDPPPPEPVRETTSNSTLPEELAAVPPEVVPETSMPPQGRGDPECMDWNSLEYWRSATFEAARDCFEAGADVQARAVDGSTPLHYVIQGGGKVAVIELLLAAGADINAPLDDGSKPLHLAAEYAEHREVVAALVRAGADPNARNADRFNFTPLHYAAQFSRHPDVIEALLDHGADPNAQSSGGLIPWDLAKDRDDLLASEALRRLTPSGLRN